MMSVNTNHPAKTLFTDPLKLATLAQKALARGLPLRFRVELRRLLLLPRDGADLLLGRRGDLARALTKYLAGGSYEGIDIVPQGSISLI